MSFPVICIGAALVDELFFCTEKTVAASSNPATLKRFAGGVVRNIASQLAMLDIPVQLITVLGNDPDGEWLMNDCVTSGIGMKGVLRVADQTGKYVSILDKGGALYAAVCADPCGQYLTPLFLQQQIELLVTAAMIVTDTNMEEATLCWLIAFSKEHKIPLFIEPVSVSKAKKLACIDISAVFMITPNEDELSSLCKEAEQFADSYIDTLLKRGVKNIWLRKAANGSTIFNKQGKLDLHAPLINITDSTGAGDAALAGWIAAYYLGLEPIDCLRAGHAMAIEVLQVHGAAVSGFSQKKLFNSIKKYFPDEQ